MRFLDLMRLAPLVLLAAILCFFQFAKAAPDLDVFPEVKNQKKAVICTQLRCPPCAAMKKEIEGKKFPFQIEWASTRDKKWAVKAAPTTIKLVADKEVDRKVGFISAVDLTAWMAK
jgi:hypothetical protein